MTSVFPLRYRKFHDLMPHRVREVLLVSSLYDAFILQEDGHLSEQIFLEYKELSLSSAPRFTHVTTAEAALKALENRRFDLVLVMPRLPDMELYRFGRKVKKLRPGRPVVVLAFESKEVNRLRALVSPDSIDAVFIWNGDAKILLAVTKYIEDRENCDHDIAVADVRVILVIEDDIRFYSSFLAHLYPELMKQSQSLFSEGFNRLQKLMRMRTRPKILHASNYEEAMRLIKKYRDNLLGIISDVGFPREGVHDREAGLKLIEEVRNCAPDMPALLQSFDEDYAAKAQELGVHFVNKYSTSLLYEIGRFLKDYLGFGPFVFRRPDGTEIMRASDVRELEKIIKQVPADSLEYHAQRNHVSNWLMARSEFELAARLKPQQVSDFPSVEDVRQHLLAELKKLREETRRGVIADFSVEKFEPDTIFQRIGHGSLGGKARGLAFLNLLLTSKPYNGMMAGMPVQIPQTFVLATDWFDRFMDRNQLHEFAYRTDDDETIATRFVQAELPNDLRENLDVIVDKVTCPLAVRSSSMLEDDMLHPFAGIYRTIMIPNSQSDRTARLQNLCNAVKLVFASTFFRNAKAYVENTAHRVEEEKMAVVIQRLVGQQYGDRFYPHFAGVAHSYNYYPLGPVKAEDGVMQMVLGLGRLVVDGGQGLRFCPRYPAVAPQMATPELVWKNSQNQFYALDLNCCDITPESYILSNLRLYDLPLALDDGPLKLVGSIYNKQDDTIVEGGDAKGPWVVTFNNILKHQSVPLAPAMVELLKLTSSGLGTAVELEFAVDMGDVGRRTRRGQPRRRPTLFPLQLRPTVTQDSLTELQVEVFAPEQVVCRSNQALGHGRVEELTDIVYVKNENFDPAKSPQIARQVGTINQQLRQDKRPYVLIGPGRWGSSDHWLGIPVQWAQISGAKIIIEASPSGYNVDPSQGTHFFHNITSLQIGYFTIPPGSQPTDRTNGNFVDWEWLDRQPALDETEYLRHVRLEKPLVALIDGRENVGVIAQTE